MKIGLKLPSSGPLATAAFIAEIAAMADQLGYHSLQVSDHVVLPAQVGSRYPYGAARAAAFQPETVYYEPIGLLGYLSGKTQHVRLGPSVLVLPYRQPVVAAKQLATIDALSGGRLFIGVGTGWMEEEFKILGSPPFAERGAITDEYIQAFRTLWRDDVPEFHGRYVEFPPLGARPQPAQRPGIPILVGGNTRPAIRRAVRLGDGWQPLKLTPDDLSTSLAYLRRQAQTISRDLRGFEISLGLSLRMTKGPAERRPTEGDLETTLIGSAQQVIGSLQTYQSLGVTEVAFDLRPCLDEDEVRKTVQICGEDLVHAFAS